jgi:purine-binding chemotaxis protein CheW
MSVFDRFSAEELAILKQRAERVAHTAQEDDHGALISALTIQLDNENYALPVEDLTAVYSEIEVVPVPWTPTYVSGIANVRGRIIPVFDLGVLLDVPGHANADAGPLIVASNDELTLAFRVGAVGDVLNFSSHEVEPVPLNMESKQVSYFQGVLHDGTAVLNMRAILNDPALIVADGAAID